MSNQENKSEKRACSFFASDYHFEMISLPVIERELEKEKEVVIFTENNLEKTVNTLLERVNLKEEKKEKIKNLNWKNDDVFKMEQIRKNQENSVVVFIKGEEDYIQKIHQEMKSVILPKNSEIIDCYDVNKMGTDLSDIAKNYGSILNTSSL